MAVVMGFGGVINENGTLNINPKLPKAWDKLSFSIYWKNEKINIDISKQLIKITKDSKTTVDLVVKGKKYSILKEIIIQ